MESEIWRCAEELATVKWEMRKHEDFYDHFCDFSGTIFSRFLRAKKTVERATENVKSYDAFRSVRCLGP